MSAEFISLAREHYLNDNPNPRRVGCPPPDSWLKLARSKDLPDDSQRLHLLSCSPCLNDFRQARELQNDAPAAKSKLSWLSFLRLPLPVAAMFLLVISSVGAGIYFWLIKPQTEIASVNGQIETQNQNTNLPENQTEKPVKQDLQIKAEESVNDSNAANPAKTKSLENRKPGAKSPKPEKPVKENFAEETLLAKNTINLDLAKAAVLRGANTTQKVYQLSAKTMNFIVKLPLNSPSGKYEISLLDESHEPLIAQKTVTSSGKNVRFDLTLQNKNGRARLCINPVGEIPDCFAVKIGNEK